MAFPGLCNEVTRVSTEPTTVPTAAVLTHVLHLLMYLLWHVRTYCTYYCTSCTRPYYTYSCPVSTTYWHRYELHCWWTCVYIWKNKKYTPAWMNECRIDRYFILYSHTASTDVCTACTCCWCKYVYWKKNTSCCKYVPTAVRTYLLHLPGTLVYLVMYARTYCTYCRSYWCTYVPTVRTALMLQVHTYCTYCTYLLLYLRLMYVFIYCCTYFPYLLQVPTEFVRTERKKSRGLRVKRLAGGDKVIGAVTTPQRGRNRAKIIPQ